MLVSIITPVLNAEATIEDTIKSVLGQSYANIEYIIVDNGSTDATLKIIEKYKHNITKLAFETQKGIYTTMNKGLSLASGDIVGILNSDDFYVNNSIVETIVKVMSEKKVDACYGDLVYVGRYDTDKVIRYWRSSQYHEGLFDKGWIPAHPTFFVKRWVYDKYGVFDSSLPVVADHELLLRFMYQHKIKTYYVPQVLVKMRLGGLSNNNILNIFKQNLAIIKTLRKNKIKVFLPLFFVNKFMERLKQFFYKS